jgi:hypothetical protein
MARQKKTGIIAEVRKARNKKGSLNKSPKAAPNPAAIEAFIEKSKVTAKQRIHKVRQRRPKGSRYAI